MSQIETNPFFSISADGERAIYTNRGILGTRELFSLPTDGGSPIRLNSFLSRNGDVRTFHVSPYVNQTLYLADQDIDGIFELFSAPASRANSSSSIYIIKAINGNVIVFEL